MTGIAISCHDSKQIAEPKANLDRWEGGRAPEQCPSSVYAAFWQARSGLFDLAPKPATTRIDPVASIDPVRSRPP